MSTETPEGELSILEERRGELKARLAELIPIRGDERAELARAVAFAADASELVERRARVAELNTEAEGIEDAVQLLEVRIAEVAAVVADRERERKIARADQKKADYIEHARKLQDRVLTFAQTEWAPLFREAQTAWNEAVQAETESRRAQGMDREDIHRTQYDIGYPSSGDRGIDTGLDRLAFPPPRNPND